MIRYGMDRKVAVFTSFADAARAEDEYYASLSPEERVDVLLDMVRQYREALGETADRFERVHRVVELSRG